MGFGEVLGSKPNKEVSQEEIRVGDLQWYIEKQRGRKPREVEEKTRSAGVVGF